MSSDASFQIDDTPVDRSHIQTISEINENRIVGSLISYHKAVYNYEMIFSVPRPDHLSFTIKVTSMNPDQRNHNVTDITSHNTSSSCYREKGTRAEKTHRGLDLNEENRIRIYLKYQTNPNDRFYGFGEQFTFTDSSGRCVPILVQEGGVGRGLQPGNTHVRETGERKTNMAYR